MKKQDKQVLIDKLTKNLADAKSVTLVDFTGMNMQSQNDLKKKLKEASSKLVVAKNTLIKLSAINAKLPKELTDEVATFKGQTALILGIEDPVAPIQITGKNEAVKFKAGVVEGTYQNKEGLMMISKLPSKEVLVGTTVGSVAGPLYGIINNLEANIQQLLGILTAKVG